MSYLRPVQFAVFCVLSATACAPALSKAYLDESQVAELKGDTSGSCIVGADIYQKASPSSLGEVTILTSDGKTHATGGVDGALGTADGFTFVNVPKGPFRIVDIRYEKDTLKVDRLGKEIMLPFNYSTKPGAFHMGEGGTGPMPNEMSGTCNGGFIWLGEFKGDSGGTFSKPSLSLSRTTNESFTKEVLLNTKAKLAGTPWAAEVDKMQPNKPLTDTELK